MQSNDVERTWHSSVASLRMSIWTLSTLLVPSAIPPSKYACLMSLYNILPFRDRVTRITALNDVTWLESRSWQTFGRRCLFAQQKQAKRETSPAPAKRYRRFCLTDFSLTLWNANPRVFVPARIEINEFLKRKIRNSIGAGRNDVEYRKTIRTSVLVTLLRERWKTRQIFSYVLFRK